MLTLAKTPPPLSGHSARRTTKSSNQTIISRFDVNNINQFPMKRIALTITLFLSSLTLFATGDEPVRISILGDSYSTYEGWLTPDTNAVWYADAGRERHQKGNDVQKVSQTWWYTVVNQPNARLELNNSYSGSTVCNTGYNKADFSDRSFITRSPYLGEPDVIFVFGATNDSWSGAPVGKYMYGGWTKEALYCFRPAMSKLLADMKTNYPSARIIFILNTELRDEINSSVLTICRHYDIPCLVLTDIDKQQGHPSQQGMKQIADQVLRFCAELNIKL